MTAYAIIGSGLLLALFVAWYAFREARQAGSAAEKATLTAHQLEDTKEKIDAAEDASVRAAGDPRYAQRVRDKYTQR
ncbi:MAG: hypothetical protein ACHQF3_08575 [Alphaproteobacteria bacterium]